MIRVRGGIEIGRYLLLHLYSSSVSLGPRRAHDFLWLFRWNISRQEISKVGEPLLLVYDQIFDNSKVLGIGLLDQMRRRVAIRAGIIHVNVHVAADPFTRLVGNVRF